MLQRKVQRRALQARHMTALLWTPLSRRQAAGSAVNRVTMTTLIEKVPYLVKLLVSNLWLSDYVVDFNF